MKVLVASAIVLASASASAQVTFSTSFEPIAYSFGLHLDGQAGWVEGSGVDHIPLVVNSTVFDGSQSVQLNGFAGSGSTFFSVAQPFDAGAPSPSTDILTASAQIWLDSVSSLDRYFGVQFGTGTLSSTTVLGIALGGNGLRGGGGSYGAFNGITAGLLQSRTTADYLQRWIGLSVTADRSQTTNNVTYQFSNLGTAGGKTTESFTGSVDFGTLPIRDVMVVSDYDTDSSSAGLAFIDSVSFTAVPEPATIGALGLGALALARRRKNR